MTGLQETFYIIGIIYMGLSLVLILALVIAIGVIRSKIVSLERVVHEKLDTVLSLARAGGEVVEAVKNFTKHKA